MSEHGAFYREWHLSGRARAPANRTQEDLYAVIDRGRRLGKHEVVRIQVRGRHPVQTNRPRVLRRPVPSLGWLPLVTDSGGHSEVGNQPIPNSLPSRPQPLMAAKATSTSADRTAPASIGGPVR